MIEVRVAMDKAKKQLGRRLGRRLALGACLQMCLLAVAVEAQEPTLASVGEQHLPSFGEHPLWSDSGATASAGGSYIGFDQSQMRLGIQVDYINFSRSGLDDQDFVFDQDTFEPLLNFRDVNPSAESTARIRILYQSDLGTGFEFGFFDADNFNGSATVENGLPELFGGIPADPAASYDISDTSQLESYELNAWGRRNERVRLGIGLRALDFRNSFNSIETGSATGNSTGRGFFSDSDNDLFGGQVSAELYRPLGPALQLETGVRFGLYNNSADIEFTSANRDFSYDDDTLSTVVDLSIGLSWTITSYFRLRAGYNAIFIGDLATASAQSPDFDFFATSAPVVFSNLSFRGGYFGGEMRF